jgi:hypothetical protein
MLLTGAIRVMDTIHVMDTLKKSELMKPTVANLGICVIERDGKAFLVMFPDGSVRGFSDYSVAVNQISKYFAKHTPKDAIGVGQFVSYDGSIVTKVARNGFVVEV